MAPAQHCQAPDPEAAAAALAGDIAQANTILLRSITHHTFPPAGPSSRAHGATQWAAQPCVPSANMFVLLPVSLLNVVSPSGVVTTPCAVCCSRRGLASKRSGLAHKLHCILHVARLETTSLRQLAVFTKSTASMTSDLGVEHLLSEARCDTPLADLLPAFCDMGCDDESVEVGDEIIPGLGDDEKLYLSDHILPMSVTVCGILHILHNACKDSGRHRWGRLCCE